ncbi:DUF2163 domain-containing protein [Acuticoccus mangrovi]|uniref:DUF2163 domain-containing protein n=1 Tax=Acuticoccus mangrovi TaxID=2796142 RepID=A0A934IDZ2_9HYPH|nr:DUF2163 domain-containing protein [Acuticoccus mangrovi]MBJ3774814.1 DUF2163 domain-containing protein [Acuticoccus mangrovi]
MRVLGAPLREHLESGLTTTCRCWRIARTDGVVQGFTDHDLAVTFDGLTFSPLSGFEATGDVTRADLSVGGLEIAGALTSAGLDAVDLQSGRYDFASVMMWLVNWQDPEERVLLRQGTLGEVVREDGAFRAEVRGPMRQLETIRGRVYTATCDADLGDARCTVDLSALSRIASVASVDGALVIVNGIDFKAAGWASQGVLEVTSGDETGRRELVTSHAVIDDQVVLTLRSAIVGLEAGDMLLVTPGCDKRFATCRKKFSNHLNFQGFPHLPGNDRAFSYARSSS